MRSNSAAAVQETLTAWLPFAKTGAARLFIIIVIVANACRQTVV
jgi:hypothetical protein